MDSQLRDNLVERFVEGNSKLEKLIGLDLTDWNK